MPHLTLFSTDLMIILVAFYRCTTGGYSQQLQEIAYLNHRAFLPQVELPFCHRYPQEYVFTLPQPKTQTYVDWADGSYSAAATNKEQTKITRESGCKGPY